MLLSELFYVIDDSYRERNKPPPKLGRRVPLRDRIISKTMHRLITERGLDQLHAAAIVAKRFNLKTSVDSIATKYRRHRDSGVIPRVPTVKGDRART